MWMPLLLVLSMLSLSMCAGIQSANNHGWLTLDTITPKLVEGTYFSRDRGIHFMSKVGGVSITTLGEEGEREEPLFIVSTAPNKAIIASVLGHQFLLVDTPTERAKVYGIPRSMSFRVRMAAKSPDPRNLERVLPELDHFAFTAEYALEQFLSHPDVQLIVDAAVAMGNEGITGKRFPAALPFFAAAMRFIKDVPRVKVHMPQPASVPVHSKRIVWPWEKTEKCYHGYKCPKGECPQKVSYNECLGVCGVECDCLAFVCGDCCWHKGCYDHDKFCEEQGFGTSFEANLKCWSTAPLVVLRC